MFLIAKCIQVFWHTSFSRKPQGYRFERLCCCLILTLLFYYRDGALLTFIRLPSKHFMVFFASNQSSSACRSSNLLYCHCTYAGREKTIILYKKQEETKIRHFFPHAQREQYSLAHNTFSSTISNNSLAQSLRHKEEKSHSPYNQQSAVSSYPWGSWRLSKNNFAARCVEALDAPCDELVRANKTVQCICIL